MDQVTIGITHFDRPQHLNTLIESIRNKYPHIKIVVADNSKLARPQVPNDVKLIELPPDAGLSACRNALVRDLSTKYLLVAEEDFVFTADTDIERFWKVLEGNSELAVIGGSLSVKGQTIHYAMRIIEDPCGTIRREDTAAPWQHTDGVLWRQADMVFNFFLARGEVLELFPWNEDIKIGAEHFIWFDELKDHWRVGHTPQVTAIHDTDNRSDHYQKHRRRGVKTNQEILPNVEPYGRVAKYLAEKPNIIVFGVGHSGTTILTQMLTCLGWTVPNNDPEFYEDAVAREMNQSILKGRPYQGILRYLKELKELKGPWAIKDPRMIVTLDHWLPAFCELGQSSGSYPLLLGITKDIEKVKASYGRRGYSPPYKSHGGFDIDQLADIYRRKFDLWPWAKLEISYEQLTQATALFKPR